MTVPNLTGASSFNDLIGKSTVAASSSTAATAATAGTTQNLAQTFLTLLVAQMNNQDPLNPVDNSQLTTQMAQISTVTGINTLNASVAGLVSQLQQSMALQSQTAGLQSAQLTGHSVMVAGSELNLANNTAAASGVSAIGAYSLAGPADQVSVQIFDASNKLVQTLPMPGQAAGLQDFTWDGSSADGTTAPAGSYTFKVVATSKGSPVAATDYNLQAVLGTLPQANGAVQVMLGSGQQVPYSAIAQII